MGVTTIIPLFVTTLNVNLILRFVVVLFELFFPSWYWFPELYCLESIYIYQTKAPGPEDAYNSILMKSL